MTTLTNGLFSMAAKCNTGLLMVALLGCGQPRLEGPVEPLLDDRHLPDVLVESRAVELPPALGGNRFLRGWFPWRSQGKSVLVPHADGALIEVVNLSNRVRTLELEILRLGEPGDFEARVEVAGQDLGPVALTQPLRIPLPAELPTGRVPVTITVPKNPDPVVTRASIDTALPPGQVDLGREGISQAPTSVIDFVRFVAAGARLHGVFEAPGDPGPDQSYSIVVDTEEEEPRVVFEWRNSWSSRLRSRRKLSIPLRETAGLAKIRLLARGTGSAATWYGLGIEGNTPPAARSESPPPAAPRVVLLYVLDALRGDFVDLDTGPESRTPSLARLASEGVVFIRHRSVAPNTVPSTKTLFTGQTFLTKGHAKLAVDGPQTLAEVFRAAGFRTAAFSGNGYVSEAFGTSRGFDHLADEVVFAEYTEAPDAYNDNAEKVHASALDWLDQLQTDERAFLYLHTIHPHNPYDPPERLAKRFTAGVPSGFAASSKNLLDVKHNRIDITLDDQARVRGLYEAGLAYNDEQMAVLLSELERRFRPGEILLIVTSDHGEELFDHGGVLHGYTLYREQLEIPLILWWPGNLEPRHIETVTDNTDLHETLRSLVGATPSGLGEGESLWRLTQGDKTPAAEPGIWFAAASSVKGGIFSAQSDHFKVIFAPRASGAFGMGEGRGRSRDPEFVFDLLEDPNEMINMAGSASLEVAWLRSRLHAWIERGTFLERGLEDPEIDEETRQRLRALGYLD